MLTTDGDTRSTMSAHPEMDTDRRGAAPIAGITAPEAVTVGLAPALNPVTLMAVIATTAITRALVMMPDIEGPHSCPACIPIAAGQTL
jgi:hypothetical protein